MSNDTQYIVNSQDIAGRIVTLLSRQSQITRTVCQQRDTLLLERPTVS